MMELSRTQQIAIKVLIVVIRINIWLYALIGLLAIVNLVFLGKPFKWNDLFFIVVAILFCGYKVRKLVSRMLQR